MGAIEFALTRSVSWSMPASRFSAFSRAEEAAPSKGPVLPVTTVPSGSWIAAARADRRSGRTQRAFLHVPAPTAETNSLVQQQFQLEQLILGSGVASFWSHRHLKYRRRISLREASRQILSSSTMQLPRHVHAHIGGERYGDLCLRSARTWRLQPGTPRYSGCRFTVVWPCFQVERVDHVHVVQVGGSGLVGQVYRCFQGQIPVMGKVSNFA